MKLKLEENYILRTNDFDNLDRLKPTAILDIFQDIAGRQAELIGVGYGDMLKKGYYWVVIRERITILKQPKFGSKVKVITWPNKKNRIEFTRNYRMEAENGEVIAVGGSLWVLIDIVNRRVSRARDVDYNGECYEEKVYDSLVKLPECSDFTNFYEYEVHYTDLDHNGHMNNAKYVDIILNALNPQNRENIKDLEIDFINEVKLQDRINLKYLKDANYYYFEADLEDKVIFRAKVRLENE